MGDGAGEIHPPATRRIARRHQEEAARNLNAYRITEADRLGEGGPKQKFQQNLKAIETLRILDAEERQATPEEKAALVKYVGWGAMPQVFDDYNREWARERERLQNELTPEEHEFARSTTLNAHYTAPVVIGAMYRRLERFGFRGGRVLKPAFSIGHFVGLMPEDILRRSTVTGIEIDPLTARAAKALYPDFDIRAQPFEQSKLADGFYDLAISNVPFTDTALGTIRSLEATVQGFEERATKLEMDIADAHKRGKELETKVGAPFEHEERYQELCRHQSEIEEKLDLTKNQAPSQVDATSADESEEKNSKKQEKNNAVRPKQRMKVSV